MHQLVKRAIETIYMLVQIALANRSGATGMILGFLSMGVVMLAIWTGMILTAGFVVMFASFWLPI